MNKYLKIIFIFLFLCSSFFTLSVNFVIAGECRCTVDSKTGALVPELNNEEVCEASGCTWIDDSASTKDTSSDEEVRDLIQLSGALGSSVRNLPEFIERLYNWSIATAAGVATVMIMIGGFLYLTSAGTGRVGKAKEIIGNAIVGLLLVLSAYLILNTISPSILSLEMPEIKTINRVEISYRSECTEYETEAECLARPAEERCRWLPVGGPGGGGDCVTEDINIGTNNNGCRPDDPRCDEGLRCITVNPTIIGTGRELCTDGRVGSPCFDNADCIEPTGNGFCDIASKLCLGTSDRPGAAPCTEDSQCASGECLSDGICRGSIGTEGAECSPTREEDERCNEDLFCCSWPEGGGTSCNFPAPGTLGGEADPTCIQKLDPNEECETDFQCKSNDCDNTTRNFGYDGNDICSCTGNAGTSGISPCPESMPYCITDNGTAEANFCAPGTSGAPCDDDSDCRSGLTCNDSILPYSVGECE